MIYSLLLTFQGGFGREFLESETVLFTCLFLFFVGSWNHGNRVRDHGVCTGYYITDLDISCTDLCFFSLDFIPGTV